MTLSGNSNLFAFIFSIVLCVLVEARSYEDVTRDIAIAAIIIGGVALCMACISFCVPRPKYGRREDLTRNPNTV